MNIHCHRKALLLSLLLSSIVTLQAQSPISPTAVPSDGNFLAHPRWNVRCIERVGAAIGKPVDILFIGDSITQLFGDDVQGNWDVADGVTLHYIEGDTPFPMTGRAVWEKYYGHRNALDFGVAADGTEHMLWRMQTMDIRQFKPKVVVILAGTNDTGFATPAQIAEGVKAVLDKAQQMFPDAKIILVSLTPSSRETQKIIQTNEILKTFANDHTIYYFDLYSKLTPQGDSWKGVGFDKLHLLPEGYEIWASEMDPLLKKLLW